MNCIDLTKETIKILGIHFSYNSQVENEQNYLNTVLKIEKVLKLWRMRNLLLAGKITAFKSLAISKIVYLAMMTPVPKPIVNDLCKLQKEFLRDSSKPKIKHETLCNNYENGGLKCVDIGSKIISLQCSWIKKLYEENFHEWKVILTYLIKTKLGVHFKFHSNLLVKKTTLASFPNFYKNIFNFWSTYFSSISLVDSCILSQNLWYNSYIKINNTPVYVQEFSEKNINFLCQFFDSYGNLKSWDTFKSEFNLNKTLYFKWLQLSHAIPKSWKQVIKGNQVVNDTLLLDHHLIAKNRLINVEKFSSKELYNKLIFLNLEIPTSRNYFDNKFKDESLNWEAIYLLSRKVTIDSHTRIFQYKILHNILYLNNNLFKFGIAPSPLCSFCLASEETPDHLFSRCIITASLWSELKLFFGGTIDLPDLIPQTAILGYLNIDHDSIMINHLLLVFKQYLYKSRSKGYPSIIILLGRIKKVKQIEMKIAETNPMRSKNILKKWHKVTPKLEQF